MTIFIIGLKIIMYMRLKELSKLALDFTKSIGTVVLAYLAFSLVLWVAYDLTGLGEVLGVKINFLQWFGILVIVLIFKAVNFAGTGFKKEKEEGPYRKRT